MKLESLRIVALGLVGALAVSVFTCGYQTKQKWGQQMYYEQKLLARGKQCSSKSGRPIRPGGAEVSEFQLEIRKQNDGTVGVALYFGSRQISYAVGDQKEILSALRNGEPYILRFPDPATNMRVIAALEKAQPLGSEVQK